MKLLVRLTAVLIGSCHFALSPCLATEEAPEPAAAAAPQAPQPTAQHQILFRDLGVWDAEFSLWHAGPDAPPMTGKAVETNRRLEDGLWVLSEYRCQIGPMPFVGHGQFGYDPVANKYVGTWVDTMSPYLSTMQGTHDQATDTLTMFSTSRDPQSGKLSQGKSVSEYHDSNRRTLTLYMLQDGTEDQWEKHMEIRYTRRAEK